MKLVTFRAARGRLCAGALIDDGARVLDLQAESDPFKPPEKRNEMKDEFGDRVTVAIVPGASHALIPEQPKAVVDALVAWTRSLP